MKRTKGRPVFIGRERAVCTCVSVWVCVCERQVQEVRVRGRLWEFKASK